MILERKYSITRDSNGLAIIQMSGRCTENEIANIEGNCTRRYEMITLPNTSGATLKSLDGTRPLITAVQPSTFGGKVYRCVKVDGTVNPFAYKQKAGPYVGKFILQYFIKYQEVGGVA
jgi:hypothetical protein